MFAVINLSNVISKLVKTTSPSFWRLRAKAHITEICDHLLLFLLTWKSSSSLLVLLGLQAAAMGGKKPFTDRWDFSSSNALMTASPSRVKIHLVGKKFPFHCILKTRLVILLSQGTLGNSSWDKLGVLNKEFPVQPQKYNGQDLWSRPQLGLRLR